MGCGERHRGGEGDENARRGSGVRCAKKHFGEFSRRPSLPKQITRWGDGRSRVTESSGERQFAATEVTWKEEREKSRPHKEADNSVLLIGNSLAITMQLNRRQQRKQRSECRANSQLWYAE